ncbi:chitooligosaccharidolytic beta-N-acetylglucosaminidase [Coccinella septempunctata]|uniref:chitooligosaccharidolytic beta-N-acetylglucosaminidase n=1 Tax=Coccinella septempunctata TaxID=41139 RepID=UPI001D06A4F6|nr:chitooligosaccharidolytic beta-N-acetylglucosaminidase [Coccinella septempunctata]XP_044756398.1 chitooligosaccharidolytic beta-N-acetylglucosaminidase [Coccinella septempunctata]
MWYSNDDCRIRHKGFPIGIARKLIVISIYLSSFSTSSVQGSSIKSEFKWICTNGNTQCRRVDVAYESSDAYPSVELCRLVCGEAGPLWPQPYHITITQRKLIVINPESLIIRIKPQFDTQITKDVIQVFRDNIGREYNNCRSNIETKVMVNINLSSNISHLDWNTDESYDLEVNTVSDSTVNVNINGNNIFGARHALETLSQLMTTYPESDNSTCLALLKGVKIDDKPIYSHRGLLLDTSRNFLSLKTIKKHIQAMAASKMNFLHWHISDSHSFPMETPRVPNMTIYGAYSPKKIYRYHDILELIYYGLVRGVRIVLELDAPSHAGYGWQWGPEAGLGNLTVCLNEQPWRQACIQPPCGQLNPSNKKVYDVLEKIYKDMIGLMPWSEIFHMGGDEVYIPCWNMTEEILKYMSGKGRSTQAFLDLWGEFQGEALKRYDNAIGNQNTKVIIWTSQLTDPAHIEKYLDKNRYVIQTWVPDTDELPEQLLSLGYKLIISTKNAWYLDHGFWGTTKYYDWRAVYQNQILLSPDVLGGEVCMWGEYVDDNGVLPRTWPRAAAAAERLWSNPTSPSSRVEARFYRHRERLVARGIEADAVVPRWCYLNEGQCG